jgi:hypothetical protein
MEGSNGVESAIMALSRSRQTRQDGFAGAVPPLDPPIHIPFFKDRGDTEDAYAVR